MAQKTPDPLVLKNYYYRTNHITLEVKYYALKLKIMSNIHRLSDYQNRGDIINSSQGQSGLNLRFIDLFFPGITWKHTIVWISIIQTIIYIATCIVGSWALSPSV